MLIDNQTIEANKCKIKGQLPLKHIFDFCKTFKLFFHITSKTANPQNSFFTTLAEVVQNNVAINSLYFYVPLLIPSTETHILFEESIQNIYRIFFDE